MQKKSFKWLTYLLNVLVAFRFHGFKVEGRGGGDAVGSDGGRLTGDFDDVSGGAVMENPNKKYINTMFKFL